MNSRGGVQPFGSQTGTTNVDGMNWNVWTGQQTSWKIISYVLNPGATSVSNLDLKAMFQDAVSRGSINPSNYLIDVEAGFEIWQGGQGLGTNSFSVTATAAGSRRRRHHGAVRAGEPRGHRDDGFLGLAVLVAVHGQRRRDRIPGVPQRRPGRHGHRDHVHRHRSERRRRTTRTRSPPSTRPATSRRPPTGVTATTSSNGGGGGSGCTAAYSVTNQWNSGFTANVTVTNTGTAPINGWKVNWTWGGNQQITSLWNGTLSSSGSGGDRHERGLQRLDRAGREHIVRLPGRLFGY